MDINKQILEIDQYSIFDLMGLGDMSPDQQQTMLLDINSLVWNNFLAERLTYIYTSEQIELIKEKVDNNADIKDLISLMSQLSPNFSALLAEYTRFFKIEYLRKHYNSVISDLEKLISDAKKPEVRKKLESDRSKNVRALECINSFQWEEVLKIFYPEDYLQ